jgi:hypothetical protein
MRNHFKKLIHSVNLKTKSVYASPFYTLKIDPDYIESDYSVTLIIGDTTLYMDINGYVYHGERNGTKLTAQIARKYLDEFYHKRFPDQR